MWSMILLMSRLPGGHSMFAGRTDNGGRPARRRCGRIAARDRSTVQPRSALTGVVGPSRPEGQPGRC